MMNAFLSKEELFILTGYKENRNQMNWLARNGWIYSVNTKGFPVVGREYCNAKMAGGMSNLDTAELPDFSKVA